MGGQRANCMSHTPASHPRAVARRSDSREAANGKPCIFCVVAFALIVHIHSRPGDQQKYHVRGVWPGSAPGPTRDSSHTAHTARRPARRERTSVDTTPRSSGPRPVPRRALCLSASRTRRCHSRAHTWTHEVVDVPHSQRSPPVSQAGPRLASHPPHLSPVAQYLSVYRYMITPLATFARLVAAEDLRPGQRHTHLAYIDGVTISRNLAADPTRILVPKAP